ncbi:lantibiotic dehydratase [Cupriavidus sp. amp6]|uniref:lantibiotic dehydratase n=1 Tax=Cupriavidus sp. amp6 TaxID=388051 RepID=UPI0012EC7FF0|nr:lantibiotic dehydratase [Cupriavidus sp. amp6]
MARIKKELADTGFFLMRSPALPWEVLLDWCADLSGPAGAALLRARLREIVARPQVREAIELASPGFSRRMAAWLNGCENKDALAVERVAVRYLQRLASRATPFGLFAGWASGPIGDVTRLAVAPLADHRRHIRLDAGYLQEVARSLARDACIRRHLHYRAEQTLYQAGDRLRYHEMRLGDPHPTYHLVEVKDSHYLRWVLAAAAGEEDATLNAIVEQLTVALPDLDESDALAFLDELIEAGLLRPVLPPFATGPEPGRATGAWLRDLAASHSSPSILSTIFAASDQTACPGEYPEAESKALLQALAESDCSGHKFYVDLEKPAASLSLSQHMANEIASGAELLCKLAAQREPDVLDEFARRFESRFGQREVPLLQALDEEDGIGFEAESYIGASPSSLLEGLPSTREPPKRVWHGRDQHLLQLLAQALMHQSTQVELDHADIEALVGDKPWVAPHGCAAIVSIAASDAPATARRRDYQIYLQKVIGGSSATLLGRFCHASRKLTTLVRGALRLEEACDPDAIHAEIAYLPPGKAANVVCRPILRAYEISLHASSGASRSQQIAVSDLLVSVREGKVVLRSAAMERRVVPHLGCAHAHQRGGPLLYRFLASLAAGGHAAESKFSWGALSSAPFLPRLVFGRFVLSLARWQFSGKELAAIHLLSEHDRMTAIEALRAAHRLPRLVWFLENDKTLLVDFDNALSVDSFLATARRRTSVAVSEVFPLPDQLLATGEEGSFHHELVVPLVRARRVRETLRAARAMPSGQDSRPGEDWLYLRLYAGPATLDRFLTEFVGPLAAALRAEGVIDTWFFIRYADPDCHLRWRLHGEASLLWQQVVPRVFSALAPWRNSLYRYTVDTYVPEVARYGGFQAMELAHAIFESDSVAAISIITRHRVDNESRWRAALLGMHTLLDDFGLDMDERRRVMATCRSLLLKGRAHQQALFALAAKYRELRGVVESLLSTKTRDHCEADLAIRTRSASIAPTINRLVALEADGLLGCSRAALVQSYLHMWANRIFRDCANSFELVLYDLLARHYASEMARRQSSKCQAGDN